MDTTTVGVYPANLHSSQAPAWFVSLKEARELKRLGAFFINHGRAIRLIEREVITPEVSKAGFESVWHITPSGYVPVWQMRKTRLILQ